MGSAQSLLSSENVLAAVVVAGALGTGLHQYAQSSETTAGSHTNTNINTDTNANTNITTSNKSKNKTKKKEKEKKKKVELGQEDQYPITTTSSSNFIPVSTPALALIPGQFDNEPVKTSGGANKNKKKKGRKATGATTTTTTTTTTAATTSTTIISEQGTATPKPQRQQQKNETDGSWTRVEAKRRVTDGSGGSGSGNGGKLGESASASAISDAGKSTTSYSATETGTGTGNSSPIGEGSESVKDSISPETLAEKLRPKQPKTVVDDMLESKDKPPTLARVIRIQPKPNEKPAPGFSWGDYEDVDVDSVKSHVKSRGVKSHGDTGGENDANVGEEAEEADIVEQEEAHVAEEDTEEDDDDGWGVVQSKRPRQNKNPSSTTPLSQKPSQTLTKQQRKNLKQADNKKILKKVQEEERLAALAKHKKELERIRIIEQANKVDKGSGKGGKVSGGMTSFVDGDGKLVWE